MRRMGAGGEMVEEEDQKIGSQHHGRVRFKQQIVKYILLFCGVEASSHNLLNGPSFRYVTSVPH